MDKTEVKQPKLVVAKDGSLCLDTELEAVNKKIDDAIKQAQEELKAREVKA